MKQGGFSLFVSMRVREEGTTPSSQKEVYENLEMAKYSKYKFD